MEFKLKRTSPERRRFKIVRIKTPSSPASYSLADLSPKPDWSKRLNRRNEVSLEIPPAQDDSYAARARKARQRLRRLYGMARRAAKGQARLGRADEYAVLTYAYQAVRWWQRDDIADEIEGELRAEAEVGISAASGLFLVLVRCALPRLDMKRASKWAAALEFAHHHNVRSRRLSAFIHNNGGIEGAARKRAKLRQIEAP
jgi:hypothetical protein